MDNLNLKPIFEEVLNIYGAFRVICEKHNLTFYAAYGTAIGAIRHHGFIPWDDDMDLHMPRADFERFLEIAPKELPEWYQIVSLDNTPEYTHHFCKVQETRKDVYARVEKECGSKLPQGLYIDIFPMDGVPSSRIRNALRHLKFLLIAGQALHYFNPPAGLIKKVVAAVCAFIGRPFFGKLFNSNEYARCLVREMKKIRYENQDICASGYTYVYKGNSRYSGIYPFPKRYLGTPKWVAFENTKIAVPEDYDAYLRFFYGDYMKLPPEADQKTPYHEIEPLAPWKYGPTIKK